MNKKHNIISYIFILLVLLSGSARADDESPVIENDPQEHGDVRYLIPSSRPGLQYRAKISLKFKAGVLQVLNFVKRDFGLPANQAFEYVNENISEDFITNIIVIVDSEGEKKQYLLNPATISNKSHSQFKIGDIKKIDVFVIAVDKQTGEKFSKKLTLSDKYFIDNGEPFKAGKHYIPIKAKEGVAIPQEELNEGHSEEAAEKPANQSQINGVILPIALYKSQFFPSSKQKVKLVHKSESNKTRSFLTFKVKNGVLSIKNLERSSFGFMSLKTQTGLVAPPVIVINDRKNNQQYILNTLELTRNGLARYTLPTELDNIEIQLNTQAGNWETASGLDTVYLKKSANKKSKVKVDPTELYPARMFEKSFASYLEQFKMLFANETLRDFQSTENGEVNTLKYSVDVGSELFEGSFDFAVSKNILRIEHFQNNRLLSHMSERKPSPLNFKAVFALATKTHLVTIELTPDSFGDGEYAKFELPEEVSGNDLVIYPLLDVFDSNLQ